MPADNASPATETLTLDAFLGHQPADVAARLRTEAARIDELERYAHPVRGIEQRLRMPALIASAMFVVGLALFWIIEAALAWIGEVGFLVLLGALPGLATYYAYRVRWRTKADKAAFDINRDHFLPHGVIYFAPAEPGADGKIVPVDASKAYKPKPTKNDKLKPGWIW